MRRITRLVVAAVVLLTSGCGLESSFALPFEVAPGSIRPVPELAGVDIAVGSKDFTENQVLGYLAEVALVAAGAEVRDLTNIQGSNSSRQALLTGDIDLSWDYTGTGWVNILGNAEAVFPYSSPTIFSMPLAFLTIWLVSVTEEPGRWVDAIRSMPADGQRTRRELRGGRLQQSHRHRARYCPRRVPHAPPLRRRPRRGSPRS